jgi:PDZ domain
MNVHSLLRASIAVCLGSTGAFVPAQQNDGDHKVRIDITRTENGKKSHTIREFDLTDEQQLADALRELGVMDELNVIGNDENLVLDLRRMRNGGMLNDICIALSNAQAPEEDAYLGVYYSDWNEEYARKEGKKGPPVKAGAYVTSLDEGTPAEKAGLRSGDVIVALGGKPVGNGSDLVDAIGAHKPGDQVEVTYYRGRDKNTTKVTLTGRHSSNYDIVWSDEDATRAAEDATREAEDAIRAAEDAMRSDEDARNAWSRSMSVADDGAFLGVDGDDVEGGGVSITEVTDSSAAQQMGLHLGDVIKTINDKSIDNFEELAERIDDMKAGDEVRVKVIRNGQAQTFSGTLGQRRPIMWNWTGNVPMDPSGNNMVPAMPDVPDMPDMPDMPAMPDMSNFAPNGGWSTEMQDELRRSMEQLRAEMQRMRNELRGDIVNEIHLNVDASALSLDESTLLKGKGVTNLESALDLPGLELYPGHDSFNIQFEAPQRGDLNLDMHDAQGERVYHESITGFKGNYQRVLDWSDRPDGTYFIVISQNGRTLARKLVKG